MRYYVDCEFNGNEGQLLSIALVRQDGAEFYAVLDVYQMPQPWVAKHVMNVMWEHAAGGGTVTGSRVAGHGHHADEREVSRADCKKSLRKFLEKDAGPHTFVGDWPEDVVHLCNLLLCDHGKRNPPVQFRCVLLDLPGFNTADHSAVPHNALEDARVLQRYVEQGLQDAAEHGGKGTALTAQDLQLLTHT